MSNANLKASIARAKARRDRAHVANAPLVNQCNGAVSYAAPRYLERPDYVWTGPRLGRL